MNDWSIKLQHTFIQEYFKIVADFLPGNITLNQIRILQYIALRSLDDAPGPTHTEICQFLEMQISTVSRALTGFLADRIIRQELSPVDGRQRFVTLNPAYSQKGMLDKEIELLAKRYISAS